MNEKNEYVETFRITFFIVKISSISPFLFWNRGASKSLLFSRTVSLISVVLYFFVLPQQLTYMGANMNKIFHNFDFNILMRVLPTITFRITLLSMPFITWNKAKLIHHHCHSWGKYQTELERLTGTTLSLSRKNTIRWVPVTVALVIIAFSIIMKTYYHKNANINPSYPSLIYTMGTSLFISSYWYANCLFVQSIARELQLVIKDATRNNDNGRLRRATELWLKLCDLNEQFDEIHSSFFYVNMSAGVVNMVASIYSFLYVLIYEVNKMIGVAHMVYTTFMIIILRFYCESSNSVFNSVVYHVNNTILNQKTTNMDVKSLRTMVTFLQLMETRKPKVTLNKILVLNRSEIMSILTAIVNYLIVMKQFATMKYQSK